MRILAKLLLSAGFVWAVGVSPSYAAQGERTDAKPANSEQAAPAKAAEPDEPAVDTPEAIASDVALSGNEGVLLGQVVNSTGAAVSGKAISLSSGGRVVARGKSDKHGYFAFRQLRGGVYQVAANDGFATVRAWTAGTAPKAAKPKVLLVTGRRTVRGQRSPDGGYRGGCLRRLARRPVVVAGVIATAVAVPLAVCDSKKDDCNGEVTPVPEPIEGITEGPGSP